MTDLTRHQFCPGGLIDARHLTHCTAHPEGPTMTTISNKDRAEAQRLAETLQGCTPLAALSNNGVRRWLAVRGHVLAQHECPSLPVWRPVTRDEIRPGWEVRSRHRDGSEAGWGVAHVRDYGGDWNTEAGALLTSGHYGWTYETTAPLPEPEPDPLVDVVLEWMFDPERDSPEDDARELLARLAAAAKGERS